MPVIENTAALAKITDVSARGGQEARNVYWYRATVNPDTVNLQNLANGFEAAVLVPQANLTHQAWVHTLLQVDIVNGLPAPFERASGVGAGAVVGDAMPNYSSFSIKLNRTTKETRNGWKRIPGVTEQMVSGDVFEAATVALWDAYAPILAAPVVDPGTVTWSPVIVRTEIEGVPLEPTAYIYNPVVSSVFLNRVTTQRTRRRF